MKETTQEVECSEPLKPAVLGYLWTDGTVWLGEAQSPQMDWLQRLHGKAYVVVTSESTVKKLLEHVSIGQIAKFMTALSAAKRMAASTSVF